MNHSFFKIDRYTAAFFLFLVSGIFGLRTGNKAFVIPFVGAFAWMLYLAIRGRTRVIDNDYSGRFAKKNEHNTDIVIFSNGETPENFDGLKTADCPLIFKAANGTDVTISADGVVHSAGPGSWLVNTLRGAGNTPPEMLPSDWYLLKEVKL